MSNRQVSERDLEELQGNIEYHNGVLKVFLADIVPKDVRLKRNMEDRMVELENLVKTYNGVVIMKHVQNKEIPDYDTFMGEGRLDDIIEEMEEMGANVLVLGSPLKPSQIYNINDKLKFIGAKAWDRVDLILKIFERNAKSREAKLQIELASIKHMGPRIFDMGMELGKQGGQGKGETNTEIMKRHLAKKEEHVRKELDKYSKVREQHRQGRAKKGMLTVGVVGYTNAGKSTLTNFYTKKGVLAEDKLFATLGTSVGKMFVEASYDEKTNVYIPPKEILVNDTIGFIRELPPKLVDAFKSTLEDSAESNLLLHVIDASDPRLEEKIEVVEEILEKIGANQKRINVFNKIDVLNNVDDLKERFSHLNPLFISVNENIGMSELKELIIKEI
ncbi:MAG: GTPase HflX [Candidatus Gracilibacteria bacterium]|nr:GTPase HflX [Candidatus Gracilibacteria bacterium]